jgi:hypothetical protein
MSRRFFAIGAALTLFSATVDLAVAQSAPQRVRGIIEQVAPDAVTIKAADGALTVLPLAPDVRIGSQKALTLADIKPGDYIGVAATRQSDGRLVADSVNVFPATARGVGEGQRPFEGGPDSVMTNANVDQVASGLNGNVLKLSFKGGTAEIEIKPDTPIRTPVPGDMSLLAAGRAVIASVRTSTDGKPMAGNLTVEKDGVKPR